jgi:hypothetical protein
MKLILVCILVFQSIAPSNTGIGSLQSITHTGYPPLTYEFVSSQVSPEKALETIQVLSSPVFTGRQSGTQGCESAAEWISQYMDSLHLKPCQIDGLGSFYQTFSVPLVQILDSTECIVHGEETIKFEYRNEFYPFFKSDSGSYKSESIFVGYGLITSEYNDYKNIDVRNKTVVILSGKPSFLHTSDYIDVTDIQRKITTAKKQGAKSVLLIDQNATSTTRNWNRKEVWDPGVIPDILCGLLSLNAGEKILNIHSLSIDSIVQKIESSKQSFTFQIQEEIELTISISKQKKQTSNVIGYIPAQKPTTKSFLFVAHYDHLGQDLVNADIFAGSNDNASGVSIVLEVARILQQYHASANYHIVFIAFSGEEEGLLGSKWYVDNPLFPLEEIVAVINLDMVGVGDSEIIAGTDPDFFPALGKSIRFSADQFDIPIQFHPGSLWSGSDQYYFYQNNVPCVFFWRSGLQVWETYHTPQDVPELVQLKNLKETLQLCTYTVLLMTDASFSILPIPLLSQQFGYQFEA